MPQDGASWVPVRAAVPASGRELGPVEVRPFALARVWAAGGPWEGREGLLLVFNLDQPEVVLRRGDALAVLESAPASSDPPPPASRRRRRTSRT